MSRQTGARFVIEGRTIRSPLGQPIDVSVIYAKWRRLPPCREWLSGLSPPLEPPVISPVVWQRFRLPAFAPTESSPVLVPFHQT
ncbi:MAG: hypothetical protein JWM11_7686 [Planctomycetaceae bacterium]|nr:hypothetical protein [Planctomycetaceae bacterium]